MGPAMIRTRGMASRVRVSQTHGARCTNKTRINLAPRNEELGRKNVMRLGDVEVKYIPGFGSPFISFQTSKFANT